MGKKWGDFAKSRIRATCAVLAVAGSAQSCGQKTDYEESCVLSSSCPQGSVSTNSSGSSGSSSSASSSSTVSRSAIASFFPSDLFFNRSVVASAVDAQSTLLINALNSRGGWGTGMFQIDFSIDVFHADSSNSRTVSFVGESSMFRPDSDELSNILIPRDPASVAGFESGSRICNGGDCHYIVFDPVGKNLSEAFVASVQGDGAFHVAGSFALWPFGPNANYTSRLRGDVCTSADAGGLPIAPMLFTADEVASGRIAHAIRFILPNSRIQYRQYVRPATHGTGGSGWATENGVPYGARFRLKANFDESKLPNAGAKVVARALKEFGMILSDGGNIALTAQSDRNSISKWSGLLNQKDLGLIKVTDFEMIDAGPRINFTQFDCVRVSL